MRVRVGPPGACAWATARRRSRVARAQARRPLSRRGRQAGGCALRRCRRPQSTIGDRRCEGIRAGCGVPVGLGTLPRLLGLVARPRQLQAAGERRRRARHEALEHLGGATPVAAPGRIQPCVLLRDVDRVHATARGHEAQSEADGHLRVVGVAAWDALKPPTKLLLRLGYVGGDAAVHLGNAVTRHHLAAGTKRVADGRSQQAAPGARRQLVCSPDSSAAAQREQRHASCDGGEEDRSEHRGLGSGRHDACVEPIAAIPSASATPREARQRTRPPGRALTRRDCNSSGRDLAQSGAVHV